MGQESVGPTSDSEEKRKDKVKNRQIHDKPTRAVSRMGGRGEFCCTVFLRSDLSVCTACGKVPSPR